MEYIEQLELVKRDLANKESDLYLYVFLASGLTEEEFLAKMEENINLANEPTFYGGHDTVYCAYTYIDGNQVYFKFSAPKEEMKVAVGSSAPYLEMYRGGVYLQELGPNMLFKYAMAYYYKEFATYSASYADHPKVKSWKDFMISED